MGTTYGSTGRLRQAISPASVLKVCTWQNQSTVGLLRMIDTMMIKAPAALGSIERGGGGDIGAIEDRGQFERAHQFVRVARDETWQVVADFAQTLLRDFEISAVTFGGCR